MGTSSRSHSLALSYGLLNWVTGGLFLGERHVYMAPQVDDIFIDDDVYGEGPTASTRSTGRPRPHGNRRKQLQSQTSDLLLHMAFNGVGTTGTYSPDLLTPAVDLTDSRFPWINHTFTHQNLDPDSASYDRVYWEITRNNQTAASMDSRTTTAAR